MIKGEEFMRKIVKIVAIVIIFASVIGVSQVFAIDNSSNVPSVFLLRIDGKQFILIKDEVGVKGYSMGKIYEGTMRSIKDGYVINLYRVSRYDEEQEQISVVVKGASEGYIWTSYEYDKEKKIYRLRDRKVYNLKLVIEGQKEEKEIFKAKLRKAKISASGTDVKLHPNLEIEGGKDNIEGNIVSYTQGTYYYQVGIPFYEDVWFSAPIKIMPLIGSGGTDAVGIAVFANKELMEKDWKQQGGKWLGEVDIDNIKLTITILDKSKQPLAVNWSWGAYQNIVYFNPPASSFWSGSEGVTTIGGLVGVVAVAGEVEVVSKVTDFVGYLLNDLFGWLASFTGVKWENEGVSMKLRAYLDYPYMPLKSAISYTDWKYWVSKDYIPGGAFAPIYGSYSYPANTHPTYARIEGTLWIRAEATRDSCGEITFPVPVNITYRLVTP